MTEPTTPETFIDTEPGNQLEAAWLTRLESTLNKLVEAVKAQASNAAPADPETKNLLTQLLTKLSSEPTTADLSKAEQVLSAQPRRPFLTRKRR